MPVIFQVYINTIIYKILDNYYIIYLDNILVYSEIEEEYKKYIKKILKYLQYYSLYIKLSKYKFY